MVKDSTNDLKNDNENERTLNYGMSSQRTPLMAQKEPSSCHERTHQP